MSQNEKDRLVYQTPVIVPLGAMAVGVGDDCAFGTGAGDCTSGDGAGVGPCAGPPGGTCDMGTDAQRDCDTGSGVTLC